MKQNTTTIIKGNKCPYCGQKLDANMAYEDGHSPNVGDVALCIYCLNVSMYQKDMVLRKLSDEEVKNLPGYVKDQIQTGQRHFDHIIFKHN